MQQTPNLVYIKELAGDDTDFEKKFIQILKDEFPIELQTYTEHIAQQELVKAAEVVHKLKHKFNILSMSKAYEFAVVYEEELKVGNTKMSTEFSIILETIKNYLKTI